ncbi:hypothetical protein OG948_23195 [Embleya sp. NBC_00888]|uniref:hypothetical protein n=1 Tax=Embleya sp. NBC_00888 TaxID=2975960 RepID=UPI00386C9D29|nr:hypothetical protein OG948_23195 [Embleya sp. NBC_00888]
MSHAGDLRTEAIDAVLDRVARGLDTRLDMATMVRKRRSIGSATDRGTWVRIERRSLSRIEGQGWNGIEAAAVLDGVLQPRWIAGMSWRDDEARAMWRVDETELVTARPVKPGGRLLLDPLLPDAWWESLNGSLDALASQRTTRVATPDTVTITQDLVSKTIREAFPQPIDTTVHTWSAAHADFHWANVTSSCKCWILDWEDWGMAPRGLDASTLWGTSLALPQLAERVRRERRADLESAEGRVMALFFCAKVVGGYGDPADPLYEPARHEAAGLIKALQAPC